MNNMTKNKPLDQSVPERYKVSNIPILYYKDYVPTLWQSKQTSKEVMSQYLV